jgi:hypothetical protein
MRAGAVLRAGFAEVFVTGMLIRWMSVRPMAMEAPPFLRAETPETPRSETSHLAKPEHRSVSVRRPR